MQASTWEPMAQQALIEGYQRENGLERLLRRHMQEHLPKLTAELGSMFDAFLICRTNSAMEMLIDLVHNGTEPRVARSLMMTELLPLGEDDQAEAEALYRSEHEQNHSSEASPIEAGSTRT